ncbi:hypothetical protein V8C86DRAFT_49237 [Haematococcus lacustris]
MAGPPPLVVWDEGGGGQLLVVSHEGRRLSRLQWVWRVQGSEQGTVAVVDGARLLLTTLRHSLVPPPLCSLALSLPAPAAALALSSQPAVPDEQLALLLADGRLVLARCVEADLWEENLREQQELLGRQLGSEQALSRVDQLLPLLPHVLPPAPWLSQGGAAADPSSATQGGGSGGEVGTAPGRQGGGVAAAELLWGGHSVRGLVWLGPCCLLALATPPVQLDVDQSLGQQGTNSVLAAGEQGQGQGAGWAMAVCSCSWRCAGQLDTLRMMGWQLLGSCWGEAAR